jgi:acylphosphatase
MAVGACIRVKGEVQGVGFRYFILREAKLLQVNGYVRNLDDGSVEIVAEGERSAIEQLINAAKRGPRLALVDNVHVEWKEAVGNYSYFEVR